MSEKANITIEEARALVSDAALWPRMRDFLWNFAPQVHESWLEGLWREPSDVSSLMHSPRVRRYVLDSLGAEPCFHAFPKDDWSRLALVDGATLESISRWLGALACADALRRVTDGKTVRGLKAALPGVYPEVFGFTAYFRGIDFQRGDAEPLAAEHVVSTGASILFSLIEPLPPSLALRIKLKLPKDLSAPAPLRLKRETCRKALAKLLKLKFPEAYRLCCL